MSYYFSIPFANTGDQTVIPQPSQPSGDVSMEEGWTPDYALDQATDPNAKDIPRQSENWFKNVVTDALKELQEVGFKPYSALVNYPVPAFTVGSDGLLYKCLIVNGPASSVVDPVGDLTSTWKVLLAPGQDLSQNGYKIYPEDENGDIYIEQWGRDTATSGGSAVVFPIPFPNVVLGFTGIDFLGALTVPAAKGILNPTVSGFTFVSATASDTGYWRARGKSCIRNNSES